VPVAPTAEAATGELVGDWWQARRAGQRAVMLAYRREEVRDLNAAGRALMDQAGRLGADRLVLAGGEFAAGDEVLLRLTAGHVNNGNRGVIEHVDTRRARIAVRLADERRVTLDSDYLCEPGIKGQPSLVHAYAATVHAYQGATTDATFALGSPGLYRELVYTAASRHRDTVRFYLAGPDVDAELAEFHAARPERKQALERFIAQAQQSRGQYVPAQGLLRRKLGSMADHFGRQPAAPSCCAPSRCGRW
jgi:ATP-dependent exoDNAse (exonuclease V) alpha subunit